MSHDSSENLSEQARAVARKAEEVASHHAGVDLAARLAAAEEVIATQKRHLLAAANMINRLVEVISGKRT